MSGPNTFSQDPIFFPEVGERTSDARRKQRAGTVTARFQDFSDKKWHFVVKFDDGPTEELLSEQLWPMEQARLDDPIFTEVKTQVENEYESATDGAIEQADEIRLRSNLESWFGEDVSAFINKLLNKKVKVYNAHGNTVYFIDCEVSGVDYVLRMEVDNTLQGQRMRGEVFRKFQNRLVPNLKSFINDVTKQYLDK